jgi:hypothetical protein
MRAVSWILVALACGATVRAARAADPEPREHTWMEQVERDRDRGAGRIVDDSTWEAQRFEERRDVRLGRARPRRPFDTFDEDRDRELQIEAEARRRARIPTRGIGAAGVIAEHPSSSAGGAGLPSLAAVVASDQRRLAEAKQTMERSLRAVDAAEARELRLLRRRLTREGKAADYDAQRRPVEQRYEELRDGHRRTYNQLRDRILGRTPSRK